MLNVSSLYPKTYELQEGPLFLCTKERSRYEMLGLDESDDKNIKIMIGTDTAGNETNGKQILLFSLITGIFWFSRYTYVPVLAPYAEFQGASHQFVGMILGSYGLFQVVARIPFGILTDTFNNQEFFVSMGMVLSVLSGFGMWYSTNPVCCFYFVRLQVWLRRLG